MCDDVGAFCRVEACLVWFMSESQVLTADQGSLSYVSILLVHCLRRFALPSHPQSLAVLPKTSDHQQPLPTLAQRFDMLQSKYLSRKKT